MHSPDSERPDAGRRSFLLSSGGALTSAWVSVHWPSIAAAAHHAAGTADEASPHFEFFSPADAADVDAVCSQIVPSGATPGAREAHAVYFIDRSLGTYFAGMAPEYRVGLGEFQAGFRLFHPSAASFAAADPATQVAFLKTADRGRFFEATRMLTVLGMFSSPKYGGNFRSAGWTLLGFVDQHAFTPPFGYYDARYTGFVPYPTKASEKSS
jgi:hypothetical protein